MKKCPYCAEQIQDEAIFCRWCNHDLIPASQEKQVDLVVPPVPSLTLDKLVSDTERNRAKPEFQWVEPLKSKKSHNSHTVRNVIIVLLLVVLGGIAAIVFIPRANMNSTSLPTSTSVSTATRIITQASNPTQGFTQTVNLVQTKNVEYSKTQSALQKTPPTKTPTKVPSKTPTSIPTRNPTSAVIIQPTQQAPVVPTPQPTASNLVLDITIKVTNLCSERSVVIFEGPLHLKYDVGPGETKEWQGAKGTYSWTIDGVPGQQSPMELYESVWTLTLCYSP